MPLYKLIWKNSFNAFLEFSRITPFCNNTIFNLLLKESVFFIRQIHRVMFWKSIWYNLYFRDLNKRPSLLRTKSSLSLKKLYVFLKNKYTLLNYHFHVIIYQSILNCLYFFKKNLGSLVWVVLKLFSEVCHLQESYFISVPYHQLS